MLLLGLKVWTGPDWKGPPTVGNITHTHSVMEASYYVTYFSVIKM